MATLLSIFPKPEDLLAIAPEDLAGILFEVMPSLMQNQRVHFNAFRDQFYQVVGPSYPPGSHSQVELAIAEALSWLVTQGLIIADPSQPSHSWFVKTRRGQGLKTHADIEVYRKGRVLPVDLLSALFAEKVVPLFRRDDHDVAVFQAFKEVEVAVRKAANSKGAGYRDSEVGVTLMRKAFHPENGPLTNKGLEPAEREAEMHLFSGAIGHAKNPAGHRDFEISAAEAARLIVFASHLLNIVEQRR